MTQTSIAGVGLTAFGKFPNRSLKDLAAEAVHAACRDAGVDPTELDFAAGANCLAGLLTGQECIRTQTVLAPLGIKGIPLYNVENACASGSSAFRLAVQAVASGEAKLALAVGFEKMSHPDRGKTFAALSTAADLDDVADADPNRSFFMDIYADEVRAHMERYGSTVHDFALITAKNRRHGALNPRAQFQSECTPEDVLNAPTVVPPLTRLMCSPIGDGAAAVIVVPASSRPSAPVVAASELRMGSCSPSEEENDLKLLAQKAYQAAGLGPKDVSVAEVHDAASPAELTAYEDLGFAPPGDGASLIRDGATALGGTLPVNPSGGLVSRGHPIGASGLAMLVEITEQLRGRAGPRQVERARVGLVQNAGGFVAGGPAACAVHILRTP